MKNIKMIIVFLVCFLQCTYYSAVVSQAATSNKDSNRIASSAHEGRNEGVKKALSYFIYGIRNELLGLGLPESRSSRSKEMNRSKVLDSFKENLRIFFRRFDAVPGKPLVYVADPLIKWNDKSQGTIDCTLIWYVRDKDQKQITWKERETFLFRKQGSKYVIVGAKVTPLIIKYLHNPVQLKNKIYELRNPEVKNVFQSFN